MKQILLILTIVISATSFSQTDKQVRDSLMKLHNYKDTPVMKTTTQDGNTYEVGYADEVNWQNSLSYDKSYLCNFIGFKVYWALNIAKYLVTENYRRLSYDKMLLDEYEGKLTFDIVPSVTPSNVYGRAKVVIKFNDDARIKSVSFSGNPATLLHIFLWYYPTTLNVNNPKVGVSYTKHLLKEEMIFTMKSSNYATIVIKIRK